MDVLAFAAATAPTSGDADTAAIRLDAVRLRNLYDHVRLQGRAALVSEDERSFETLFGQRERCSDHLADGTRRKVGATPTASDRVVASVLATKRLCLKIQVHISRPVDGSDAVSCALAAVPMTPVKRANTNTKYGRDIDDFIALSLTAEGGRSTGCFASPAIQKGEAVCEHQNSRQRYEQAGESDEGRVHAAPVPELYVDRVNGTRATAGNIDRIAA
ncbi:hypothetical protein [Sphingomonas carotinifaciens]|uniref:hypothetical protein n=1 Tax=Sphingomonas carotinifaciens TaxID=1166323 RepID=UPI0012374702|nr:hypothetical protein [Sphingomonas carotinifaciens]